MCSWMFEGQCVCRMLFRGQPSARCHFEGRVCPRPLSTTPMHAQVSMRGHCVCRICFETLQGPFAVQLCPKRGGGNEPAQAGGVSLPARGGGGGWGVPARMAAVIVPALFMFPQKPRPSPSSCPRRSVTCAPHDTLVSKWNMGTAPHPHGEHMVITWGPRIVVFHDQPSNGTYLGQNPY
jgi:hypothetical protein